MPFHKCRLCLKIGDFCSIFEKDDAVKLSEMVMSFANIKILEGDGFSDRVCTSCIENLSTAYLFKQQCERIDSLLRKYPDIQLDKAPTSDYNELYNMEFHMHSENESVQGENDQNLIKDNSQDSDSFHSIKDNSQDSDYFHSIIKDNSQDSDKFNSVIKDNSQGSDYFHSIIKDNSQDSDKFHSVIKDNSQGSDYFHSISDTDSDVDSVKCVYCNQSYNNCERHTCHVTCTIEHNEMQRSSSNETLVAADRQHIIPSHKSIAPVMNIPEYVQVSCVLCEEKYDEYDDYVTHLNKCTTNVKVQHYVCPLCHEIFTEKLDYLKHLKINHFKVEDTVIDMGFDCVDFAPSFEKTRRPKAVRRQIGWSIEDIYQEIECTKIEEKKTPTSSPLKNFFSKLGNESFSRQSTPKKVSFKKFIENGKAKTAVYLPFRKYIQNYKMKKKANEYSPINSKTQVVSKIQATLPEVISDSDYNSPSGTSEESWKMKQNLICACDKKVFMLSDFIHDRDRIVAMINELGGVVSENTKMEMFATHFIAVLPNDTFSGMMVCALATGKWLLHISFIYDSFRCKKFLQESMYEWMKHPKILEIDTTSLEVAKAAVYWHLELQTKNAKFPFEGKQIVLIMKKKYRQYYQMVFKALKAKPVTYDPRTPGSCCTADYCFVDIKIIERVKLRFFFHHNVPVFPYQYILVYLLKRGRVENEHKYLLQECNKIKDTTYYMNNTY